MFKTLDYKSNCRGIFRKSLDFPPVALLAYPIFKFHESGWCPCKLASPTNSLLKWYICLSCTLFIHTSVTLLLAMWLGGSFQSFQDLFHTLSPQPKLSSSRMPNISPLLTPNQIQSRKPYVFIDGIRGRSGDSKFTPKIKTASERNGSNNCQQTQHTSRMTMMDIWSKSGNTISIWRESDFTNLQIAKNSSSHLWKIQDVFFGGIHLLIHLLGGSLTLRLG